LNQCINEETGKGKGEGEKGKRGKRGRGKKGKRLKGEERR
jgi:hypothetical protein